MTSLKKILRFIIVWMLEAEAKLILKRYHPHLIGITGSVGKTSAKDAIYKLLVEVFAATDRTITVRRSEKSFNSEIGLPLSILGQPNAWGNPLGWFRNLLAGLIIFLIRQKKYPTWLVLEIGADKPNDIKRFATWLKLDIAVLTSLPDVPVHLEAFISPESLIEEKISLLAAVKDGGTIILNGDDARVLAAREELALNFKERQIKIITYGFNEGNDLRLHREHIYYENEYPAGLTFKVDSGHHTIPLKLTGLIGKHQLYAPAAALAVGTAFNFNLVAMAEALINYESPAGRLRLLSGIKESTILDDTYNASPTAMTEALKTLSSITVKGKKIAVLGDMMELGSKTIEAHRQAGREAAVAADLIFTVGVRAQFIAEAARAKSFHPDNLKHFAEAREAGRALERLLASGDLVLVKGSQSMRMERVVEEIMAEPNRRGDLLCRQESEWQER